MTYPKLQRDLFQNDGAGSKLNESLLPDGLIKVSAQSFTTDQKAQARTNIGAVSYESQSLTAAQQKQALSNIGAVSYLDNTLTEAQAIQTLKNLRFDVGSAAFANSIWGGRKITDYFTLDQVYAKVQAGDFSGLFVGDYFDLTITSSYCTETIRCQFAGFDTELHHGDTELTQHHIAIVPRGCFTNSAQMNSTNTTEGAYYNSAMHQTVLPAYATAISNALGSGHLITRRRLWANAISTSVASGAYAEWTGASCDWAWYDTQLSLLTEVQVYGSRVLSSSFFDVGNGNRQLPLFALDQSQLVAGNGTTGSGRWNWWLSAVAHSTAFCGVSHNGHSTYWRASDFLGVRPLFLIH